MSFAKAAGVSIFSVAIGLMAAGCATSEGTDATFDVPTPSYYGQPPAQPGTSHSSATSSNAAAVKSDTTPPPAVGTSMMRHTLRQLAEYDAYKMGRLVNREINIKDDDDDSYLNQVAITLGQTVFIQPHFTEREVALRELKGKIDQEDYMVVLKMAADNLLQIVETSSSASDQAGGMVALTNLVTEVRALKRPELRPILQKIADANLKISEDAQKYAADPMEQLVSPSAEAVNALKAL